MGLLFNLLGAPLVGPIKLTQWVDEKIKEAADQRLGNEEKLKSELIELQMMREMDEIGQEAFEKKEKEILNAINAAKERKNRG